MGRSIFFRRLFITDDRRLALFWRLALYLSIFAACLALRDSLQAYIRERLHPFLKEPFLLLVVEASTVVVIIGTVIGVTFLFRRWLDRRPWSGMALPAPWRHPRILAAGFGIGAVMILS